MEQYLLNREKYMNKYKLVGIKNAAEKMDEYIADPVVTFVFIAFV